MKVVVLFGKKSPGEKDLKKFAPFVKMLAKKLPGDAYIDWYLLSEEEVENIEKGIECGKLNKEDINAFNKFR